MVFSNVRVVECEVWAMDECSQNGGWNCDRSDDQQPIVVADMVKVVTNGYRSYCFWDQEW